MAKFSPGEIAILWYPEMGKVSGIDFSQFHGAEVEVIGPSSVGYFGFDYDIIVPGIESKVCCTEQELRKKNQDGEHDKELTVSWDDCVWSPHKQEETTE